MSELIGQTIGQYQITAVLGEGGMATVYRAYQLSIKRDVAIKVIESKLARNPEFVKRFEREAQTVASLDHPHILKVFDFGQQGDLIYLVMELKTGGTLAKQIATQQLPLERVLELLTQIGTALDYAHRRGIIHRDLKPQNVLLDEDGNAFLTDFGIAKLIQPDYTSLTQTGAAMGTPTYMSPEQWQGKVLDARSDLYALGIMLYEMVTGQVPFRADTPASMMFAHLQETPPSLRELRPTLPRYLDPVIEKALAKSPDARFQTAKALAEAFRDALDGKQLTTPKISITPLSTNTGPVPLPPVPATRRGIGVPLIIAGVFIAILVIGGLLLASQRNNGGMTGQSVSASDTPATQVAAVPSSTLEPTVDSLGVRETIISEITETSAAVTARVSQSATVVVPPTTTNTLTASPTVTATLVPSQTPTPTSALTLNPDTASTDAFQTRRVRAVTAVAQFTQTAAALFATYTPTPDLASTEVFLTRQARARTAVAQLHQTATAWVTTSTTSPITTPTPVPTVTSNRQWTPQIMLFGGVEMVLVPPGCFEMGSDVDSDEEKPVHRVCITKPFFIDRFEVTNAQFNALGGEADSPSHWTDADRPRENITWLEAGVYCLKRGGRLPTEAEWEYAARGPSNLLYPWGNASFVPTNVIYNGNAQNQTAKVGAVYRPNGKSWVGAYDMSGNVWEFVTDYYGSYPYTAQKDPMNTTQSSQRVMRGGGWSNDIAGVQATNRNEIRFTSHYSFIGFRCVRPIEK